MTPRTALERGLEELGLELPAEAAEKLIRYLELLAKWNKTYNLTAIRDPLKMVSHHLLDSLAVVPHLPMVAGSSLADVGSGAGLPGLVLALARPEWRVAVNDKAEKKVAFLRQAALDLRLQNVTVCEGRIEQWQPTVKFSVVISRAFAELATFLQGCRHLVAPGGTLAAMKGTYPSHELARAPTSWDCHTVVPLKVPMLDAERHLVLCKAR